MFLEMATVQPEASRKEPSNEVWSTRYRLWDDRLYQFASGICLGPVYSGRLLADLQTFDPCMKQYPAALHFYRADEELLGYLRENLVALFAAVRNRNPQIVEHSRSGGSNEILLVLWGHAPIRLQNI